MSEENPAAAPVKSKWWFKLLKRCLLSPVNTLFVLVVAYFGIKVYAFDTAISDKLMLFGAIGLWLFWFLAKQIFILLLILLILCSGGYWCYTYSRQEAIKCEQSGGYWNSNTKTCETKKSLVDKFKDIFAKSATQSAENSSTQSQEKK